MAQVSREQKLVDIMFECVFVALDNAVVLKAQTKEQQAAWVAEQLRACGFDTAPVGASWGVLK